MPKQKKRNGCLRTLVVIAVVIGVWYAATHWHQMTGSQSAIERAAVIPGISAAEIYEDFLSRGFKVMRGGQEGQKWSLMKSDGSVTYSLEVVGRSSSQIAQVLGTVESKPEADVSKEAADFLGQVASRPYPGVEPSVARKWVETNIGTNSTNELGAVEFNLKGQLKGSKSLTIRAKR